MPRVRPSTARGPASRATAPMRERRSCPTIRSSRGRMLRTCCARPRTSRAERVRARSAAKGGRKEMGTGTDRRRARGALALLGSAALALAGAPAFAQPPAPQAQGIEAEGYQWNKMEGEKVEALELRGDAKRGEEAYEVCGACHLPSGAGRPDGTFP